MTDVIDTNRTRREALRDCLESGVVEAYTEGRPIQRMSDYNLSKVWLDHTEDPARFEDPNMIWRLKPKDPPKPAIAHWINLKSQTPEPGHVCLISNCHDIKLDYYRSNGRWNTNRVDHYMWWSPLPNIPVSFAPAPQLDLMDEY